MSNSDSLSQGSSKTYYSPEKTLSMEESDRRNSMSVESTDRTSTEKNRKREKPSGSQSEKDRERRTKSRKERVILKSVWVGVEERVEGKIGKKRICGQKSITVLTAQTDYRL